MRLKEGILFADGKPVNDIKAGSEAVVICNQTPFYGEGGGQVGDSGELSHGANVWRVANTQKTGHTWLHFLDADDAWEPTKLEKQHAVFAARPDVATAPARPGARGSGRAPASSRRKFFLAPIISIASASASGAMTVPISRPSSTAPPL